MYFFFLSSWDTIFFKLGQFLDLFSFPSALIHHPVSWLKHPCWSLSIFYLQEGPTPWLHSHIFTCLLDIATWVSKGHHALDIFKIELRIVPQKPAPPVIFRMPELLASSLISLFFSCSVFIVSANPVSSVFRICPEPGYFSLFLVTVTG